MLLMLHSAPKTYGLQHVLIYALKCYGCAQQHKLESFHVML